MGINGRYFPEIAHLRQLDLQSEMALRSLEALEPGMHVWQRDLPPGGIAAPIEMIMAAHSFLNHTAIVGRLLFVKGQRDRQRTAIRCGQLKELLEIAASEFPNIRRLTVRNDWEHIDERIDEFFEDWNGSLIKLELFRVIPSPPDDDTIVFLGIDPVHRRIYFLKNFVEVDEIRKELQAVRARPETSGPWGKLAAGDRPAIYDEFQKRALGRRPRQSPPAAS